MSAGTPVAPCRIPKSLGTMGLRFLSLSFWEAGFFFWTSKALHKPGNQNSKRQIVVNGRMGGRTDGQNAGFQGRFLC